MAGVGSAQATQIDRYGYLVYYVLRRYVVNDQVPGVGAQG